MRLRRQSLIWSDRSQFFHVVSRVVGRERLFGSVEKEVFARMMRQQALFSGVEVLSYCVMSNHFHLLLHVPMRPDEKTLGEEEILKRMKVYYGRKKMEQIMDELQEIENREDHNGRRQFFERMRRRMYSLSEFMKELKLRFSKWINHRKERKGTLWEERFRCSLIEGSQKALLAVSAYIDLNPVRAGMVGDPSEYRWSSHGAGIGGNRKAREGLLRVMQTLEGPPIWTEALENYRLYLHTKDSDMRAPEKGLLPSPATVSGQEISYQSQLRQRLRYFTDGVAIGCREFIEDTLKERGASITKRKYQSGFPLKGGFPGGLMSLRNLRSNPKT